MRWRSGRTHASDGLGGWLGRVRGTQKPRNFLRGFWLVPRAGIEPATRGFSAFVRDVRWRLPGPLVPGITGKFVRYVHLEVRWSAGSAVRMAVRSGVKEARRERSGPPASSVAARSAWPLAQRSAGSVPVPAQRSLSAWLDPRGGASSLAKASNIPRMASRAARKRASISSRGIDGSLLAGSGVGQ